MTLTDDLVASIRNQRLQKQIANMLQWKEIYKGPQYLNKPEVILLVEGNLNNQKAIYPFKTADLQVQTLYVQK